MRYYYADPTNNPVGPYQLEDLHQLHVEGVIHADTLVAEEGGASWFPYRSLVVPPPSPPAPPSTGPAEASAYSAPPAYSPPPAYTAPPAYSTPPPAAGTAAGGAGAAAAGPVGPHAVPQSDATTAMFLHLSSFLGIISLGAGMVIPILIWALNKDRSWFINRHGIAFINALLSYLLYGVVCGILTFVVIGFPLLVALVILNLVATVLAAVAASRGDLYEYPLAIKILK